MTDPGTPEVTPDEVTPLEKAQLADAALRSRTKCMHPDHGPDGEPIPYPGKGAPPQECAAHKGWKEKERAKRRNTSSPDVAPIRPKQSGPTSPGNVDKLTRALYLQLYQVGILLWAFPQTRQDGAIFIENAMPVAVAWGNLAKQEPEVRKVLTALTTGSAWGAAILATSGLAVQIAANHDVVPRQVGVGFKLVNAVQNGGAAQTPATVVVAPPVSAPEQPEGGNADV